METALKTHLAADHLTNAWATTWQAHNQYRSFDRSLWEWDSVPSSQVHVVQIQVVTRLAKNKRHVHACSKTSRIKVILGICFFVSSSPSFFFISVVVVALFCLLLLLLSLFFLSSDSSLSPPLLTSFLIPFSFSFLSVFFFLSFFFFFFLFLLANHLVVWAEDQVEWMHGSERRTDTQQWVRDKLREVKRKRRRCRKRLTDSYTDTNRKTITYTFSLV